jgi:hypothetical protein
MGRNGGGGAPTPPDERRVLSDAFNIERVSNYLPLGSDLGFLMPGITVARGQTGDGGQAECRNAGGVDGEVQERLVFAILCALQNRLMRRQVARIARLKTTNDR